MDIAQLVADHHQAVYRYAFRLVGSVHDAEDLTQQVFLVANAKLVQLRNEASARSWLLTILRNHFYKQSLKEHPTPAADVGINLDLIPNTDGDTLTNQDHIQKSINYLPEKLRLVLLMFYFEDLSYREIAEKLAIPIGTVMSRLARAKSQLRAQLLAMDEAESVPAERGGALNITGKQ